ncbi:MAG TPA: tripartite tricarboxylate transporter substrate binding protein [Burkholderiales bacterium]|nr:tripartite tricarboxylate transporter substrate binding protein [Burkholderiales bacterium]
MRRIVLFAAMLAVAGAACAQQDYPNRPLRMIVPWPPGQATDLVGRVMAQKMSDVLGQQIVIDNRAGAGGMIGTDVAAKATPDGYTLLAASSGPVSINPLLQKTAYDPERELAPVANVCVAPFLLVSAPSFPAQNAKEFVALLKANPGKYTFASSGTGATAHMIAEYFNNMAVVQVIHVPYKGSVPALTDVISGRVAYAFETVASTMPHVKAGRLKAYGISIDRPSALAPGIEPIAVAANLPGFNAAAWIGVMATAGTPKRIVDKLGVAAETAMKSPEVLERLASVGVEVDYQRPAVFADYLKEQKKRYSEIIKRANIKIE